MSEACHIKLREWRKPFFINILNPAFSLTFSSIEIQALNGWFFLVQNVDKKGFSPLPQFDVTGF